MMDASEIYAKRLNAKEVSTPMSGEKFTFPIADGTVKLSGGDQVRTPRPTRRTRWSSRRTRRVSFNPTSRLIVVWWWSWEWFQAIFSYRHHVEPRVKLYVPREESFTVPLKYIVVTWTTDTSLDVMLERTSRTIGTLMEIENCQIRGQVSQDSPYWMKNHQMDIHGPGRDWHENKRPPGQTFCGQRFGKICPMRRNAQKSKSGLSRNQTWSRWWGVQGYSWRMLEESWKFRCRHQCFVDFNAVRTGKPVAQLENTRQNMLVVLKPTNLWGYAWKNLLTRAMKTTSQEKAWIHWVTTIWCAYLFLCHKQWTYQMERQQWRKNGKNRENPGMAAHESQKQKWGDRWTKERGQKDPFCVVNRSLSCEEFGVGATVSEIQRSSCTPRWFHSFSFAFQFFSFQNPAGTTHRMSAFGKVERHAFSSFISFSIRFVDMGSVSFSDPGLRESSSILSNSESSRKTIFYMKIILPLNCSGSHFDPAIIFWISARFPYRLHNVANPGKFFHSNSIDSPSIRSKSLRQRVSKNHLILLSHALPGSSLIPPRHSTESGNA